VGKARWGGERMGPGVAGQQRVRSRRVAFLRAPAPAWRGVRLTRTRPLLAEAALRYGTGAVPRGPCQNTGVTQRFVARTYMRRRLFRAYQVCTAMPTACRLLLVHTDIQWLDTIDAALMRQELRISARCARRYRYARLFAVPFAFAAKSHRTAPRSHRSFTLPPLCVP